MMSNVLKFIEFIVTIFSNIKTYYMKTVNHFRKKSNLKKEKTIKKEVTDGDIDKLNDRLMK